MEEQDAAPRMLPTFLLLQRGLQCISKRHCKKLTGNFTVNIKMTQKISGVVNNAEDREVMQSDLDCLVNWAHSNKKVLIKPNIKNA